MIRTLSRLSTKLRTPLSTRSFSSRHEQPPNPHLPSSKHDQELHRYNGPSPDKILDLRDQYTNPAIISYYQEKLCIVEGKMQYLYDDKGKKYLDALGGIVTVSCGHAHPYINQKAKEQMDKIWHTTTLYLNPEFAEYCEMLANTLPEGLNRIYVVNSGSEATDLALLMARLYTGSNDVIALRNCYHGMVSTAMGVTAHSTWKYPISQGFGIHHALNPDRYRGPFGYDDSKAGEKYAWDVKNLIQHATSGKVAGFMAESIQGVGGIITYPSGYLREVYSTVRGAGGVCIADEVQTGFGRMGTNYWGFQTHGVIPDIVTMAKGIGNGFPLAAVATTDEIANCLKQRLHFNTFGGNPVSCAVGKAVIETIEKDGLQRNSLKIGAQIQEGLVELKEKYEMVGDIRGQGLMLGLDIVKSKETKEPAPNYAVSLMEKCKEYGLLIGKGGLFGNILRIAPPMCLNRDDGEFLLAALDRALHEITHPI